MTERPSIRRMQTLDREEAKLHFDVARDLDERDWKFMLDQLNSNRRDGREFNEITAREFLAIGSRIHCIDPNRDLRISAKDREDLIRESGVNGGSEVQRAANIKMLFPDFRINSRETYLADAKRLRNKARRDDDLPSLARSVFNGRILFPDENFGVTPAEWAAMDKMHQDNRSDPWSLDYIRLPAYMRLIGAPQGCVQPSFSDEDWNMLHDRLQYARRKNSGNETHHIILTAFFMKILAAKEVRVGDAGLEIVMEKREHERPISQAPEALHL